MEIVEKNMLLIFIPDNYDITICKVFMKCFAYDNEYFLRQQ